MTVLGWISAGVALGGMAAVVWLEIADNRGSVSQHVLHVARSMFATGKMQALPMPTPRVHPPDTQPLPRPASKPSAPRAAWQWLRWRPKPSTVLTVALFALLASWACPPGYEKYGRHVEHGWFLLFSDTQLRVDFERLLLLDAIIVVSGAALALKLRNGLEKQDAQHH